METPGNCSSRRSCASLLSVLLRPRTKERFDRALHRERRVLASLGYASVVARWALLLLPLALACGCGYRFVSGPEGLQDVRVVSVETPRNESFQTGAEYVVAEALRAELLRRGGATLSEDPERADLVISGRVLEVESRPRSLSSVILALEIELALSLELEATRRDGSVLSLPRHLRERELYVASADVEAERKNRDEALGRVAQLAATRFLDALSLALQP